MRSVLSLISLLDRSFRPAVVFALAGVLLAAGALSAQAQNPVSTVKDNQGNDLMQIFDNGDLELFQNGDLTVPGVVELGSGGLILPDGTVIDESGDLETFGLPFSGTASTSDPALEVENTGSGPAGVFNGAVGIGTASPSSPLTVGGAIESTSGGLVLPDGAVLDEANDLGQLALPFSESASESSPLFELTQTGANAAGVFEISNSSSSANALLARTDGSGTAGFFDINNASSSAAALVAETDGSGDALEADNFGSGSAVDAFTSGSGDALEASTNGSGNALLALAGGSGDALFAQNNGSGKAGVFEIDNFSSSATALDVSTNGSGRALFARSFGSGNALQVRAVGGGKAGRFTVNDPNSSAPALEASTAGSGDAFHAVGAGDDGFEVESAGDDGFEVESAGGAGFQANNATNHGVFIGEVGSPSTTPSQPNPKSAFEVKGVEGNGLSVGRADKDGVLILDAGEDGIDVEGATDNAGEFGGDVLVEGDLNVNGSKNFKIDHPQAPTEKYLKHAAVESPRRMNVYNGTVTTGPDGYATVQLPSYFEALNRDFRYQLTPIGTFTQAIIAEEISDNSFVVRTKKPNVKGLC